MNGLLALRNIDQEDVVKIAVRKYNAGVFNQLKKQNGKLFQRHGFSANGIGRKLMLTDQ
jgi:hypothetical protein